MKPTKTNRGAANRGPLRSMKVSDSFRKFALDQLSRVKGVHARAMFGGIGLYSDDLFFGLIASDVLYLKVDDSNRAAYEAAGAKPFRPYADRAMTMPYYEVPVAVLEDADTLAAWSKQSIAIAAASAKNKKTGRPEARPRSDTSASRRR